MSRWTLLAVAVICAVPGQLAGQAQADVLTGPVISSFVADFAAAAETTSAAIEVNTQAPLEVAQPQVRGRSGRTYMIAGAAALVGGLLIGGDAGHVIAAGGVILGVYGVILYY